MLLLAGLLSSGRTYRSAVVGRPGFTTVTRDSWGTPVIWGQMVKGQSHLKAGLIRFFKWRKWNAKGVASRQAIVAQIYNPSAHHPFLQCSHFISMSHLSEYFGDHLADVLSPLWDVWVEAVQVGAEAQGDDLEVIWGCNRTGERLVITTDLIQNSNWIK